MYRNARHIDLCLWQYFFEQGSKEAVIEALMMYQNEDGGFGHALEADNWNPNSTPITTEHALKILWEIEFFDWNHPIYKGIWNYLNTKQDLLEYGWRFTVPSNDEYAHAPWWNYSEEVNRQEYFGVTADLTAFILMYGETKSEMYDKALVFANQLMDALMNGSKYGDMGLEAYMTLLTAIKKTGLSYDIDKAVSTLGEKIKRSIEHDTSKWKEYGVRPSNYIHSPSSIFYKENEEIVQKELQYLIDTKPENDVWEITWSWHENFSKYEKQFELSENWWKGYRAVRFTHYLQQFGKI